METWPPSPAVARALHLQSGVVARHQLRAAGHADHDVRRWVRQRRLVTLHPGVYVDHTGVATWVQRAWAAVLATAPSAVHGTSALRAVDGPGRRDAPDGDVHVAIDRRRSSPAALDGVVVHHVPRLQGSVQWNASPPRQRLEEAVLDVALHAQDELEAVGVLARVCADRRTTADRVLAALEARPRVPRRDWICQVLRDVRDGTHSALEHGYLTRVERPHSLPVADRQATSAGTLGVVYRDAVYAGAAYVELDGRLFHDSALQRDRDLDRDLDAAADGRTSVRLGWGQVFRRPCLTAARVGRFLVAAGVEVHAVGCSPGCPVADSLANQ